MCVHMLMRAAYRAPHMLLIYMPAYAPRHAQPIDKMAHTHTQKYCILFSLFSSCAQDKRWMLFCFDYSIDF